MTRARDLASMLHSDGSLNISTSVNLGDNEKAYFGDANDLVIFHNASKSIIEDVGTGNLEVRGTNIEFLDGTGSEYYLTMANNGSVGLYWDGNLKLSTTSTGVDVSGEVTATGYFRIPNNQQGGFFDVAGNNGITLVGSTGSPASTIIAYAGGSERLRIDSSGNVGIGTSSPTGFSGYTSLDINNATNGAIIDLSQGNSMKGRLIATASTMAIETSSSVPIIFQPTGTEAMRIDTSGNVGIGTSSPDLKLHVDGSNGYPAASGSTPVGHIAIRAKNESSSHGAHIGVGDSPPWATWIQAQDINNLATSYPLLLNPNGGNVGIGTTSPGVGLEVSGTGNASRLKLIDGSAQLNLGLWDGSNYRMEGDANRKILITSYHTDGVHIGNSGSSNLVIKGGNVGIGTTSPIAQSKLTVAGNSLSLTGSDANFGAGGVRGMLDLASGYLRMGAVNGGGSASGVKLLAPAGQEAVVVDTAGRATMPYQPGMNVAAASGNSGAYNSSTNGAEFCIWTAVRYNIGNHYNTSNGIFTCPVAGKYLVSFHANWSSSGAGTWMMQQLYLNGSVYEQWYASTYGAWMNEQGATVVDCAANDTIRLYKQTQSGSAGGADLNQYSSFVVRLLG